MHNSGKKKNVEIVLRDFIHFLESITFPPKAKAFGTGNTKEIYKECIGVLEKNEKVIVIEDGRGDRISDHYRMFKTSAGGLVAIPCRRREDGVIEVITLKNVYTDFNQSWYVKRYNEKAKEKGLNLMPYKFHGW